MWLVLEGELRETASMRKIPWSATVLRGHVMRNVGGF